MKRYIVTYFDKEEHDLITNIGGVILDEVPFIDTLLIAELTENMVEKLKKNPLISSVELDEEIEVQVVDYYANAEKRASFNFGVPRLKLQDYWDRGIDGTGVKVLVIDSGCANHDNLTVVDGGSFYDSSLKYWNDNSGHGTHVAGIIASKNVGNGGFVGVASGIDLYIAKASNSTKGSTSIFNSAVISALNYAIEKGIQIVNCSFAIPADTTTSVHTAFDTALSTGMIVVFSSGNSGSTSLPSFAGKDGVLTVGNLNNRDSRNGSSYGNLLKLTCYGTAIMSCSHENPKGFVAMTGTSMASPYMAGIIALYKQLFPTLTRSELIAKLIANASIPGRAEDFHVEYGYGVVMPPVELYAREIVRQSIPRGLYRTGDAECNFYTI